MASGSNDVSKYITFKWKLHFRITESKKSSTKWNVSKTFDHPNTCKVIFQMWIRLHGTNSENLDVMILKIGTLHPNRADVCVKINEKELKKTILDWDGFTEIFTFSDESCPINTEITWTIRHHTYDDYKVSDMRILSYCMGFDHMRNYYLSSELSDVVIKLQNAELPAHKIVLAVQSPVFTEMFDTDMKETKENSISFEHLDTGIVKEMLKFLYVGNIDAQTDVNVLFTLFSYTDMYQIDKLKTFCQYKLMTILNNKNVIEIASQADNYEMLALQKRIMEYLIFHKNEISFIDAINQVHNSKILKEFFCNLLKMKKL